MEYTNSEAIKYFSTSSGVSIPCRDGIEKDKFTEIWEVVENNLTIGEIGEINLQNFLEMVHKEKISIEPSNIWALSACIGFKALGNGIGVPPLISEFIFNLYEGQRLTKILDPFANFGQLLFPFYESENDCKIYGLCHTDEFLKSSKFFMPKSNLILKKNITASLNIDLLDGLGKFDLIVSAPPINLWMEPNKVSNKKVKNLFCDQLVAICGDSLSENGKLLFL